MEDKTYNGWKNWETWNVKLWLDNVEGTQRQAENCSTVEDLEELVNEITWTAEASLAQDLITSALNEVDFQEIFDAYNES